MKSFFVFMLGTSAASAKTLIFQSSGAKGQSAVAAEEPVGGASVASPAVTAVPPVQANNAASEMFFIVEQLKQEVMQLRGTVEEQAYELRKIKRQSLERYTDIDQRIQGLVSDVAKRPSSAVVPSSHPSDALVGGVAVGAATGVAANGQPTANSATALGGNVIPVSDVVTEDEKVAYNAAYRYVKEKDFPKAVEALHGFVEKYPNGDLAGNAFYWLGEVYLVLPQLEQAKQAFSIVVKTFPGHRKLADAMYKLGVAYDRMHEPGQAEQYFKMVQKSFPQSTAAKLASSYKISR